MIAGCGAGCSCHGVGQILGRSIRLGVIHHLRTTHGSGASGGPGVAAALRAGGRGATATAAAAAAVRVAAPAATAAKAGPRRPRAPRRERAREGLAISGGPCAGTFIFSPSGWPLRSRLYSDRTTLPPAPRQEHDSAGLSLGRWHPWQQQQQHIYTPAPAAAAAAAAESPARAAPGARRCFAYTQCTPGARPITGAGGWARTGRRGPGSRNVGRRGASLPSSQEQFISKVPPTPVHSGRVAQQGDPGESGSGLERSFAALSASRRAMMVGGDWYARGSAPTKLCGSPPSLGHLAAGPKLPKS